ncbi:hypothetical protein [Pseudosulfitobacter sp. DSM 107133]|uniref:NYN domain-containing protein n=1 Tax=Pseudosulfitobacter sp. DSM 107133 TaxID=2883100 RepID=UPI000DF10E79|nr:hypothetical protein [Pseudosulfitobacter sp. DSM 107133]UOA26604.1 hypothetical protein DSM107133_01306 [Pseudosulfitobacter sp. DSM 107133]
MRAPFLLFLLSCVGIAAAVLLPGWSDLLLLAGPMALAAALLLLRRPRAAPKRRPAPRKARTGPPVILDGSNVMYWKTQSPDLAPVREVVNTLTDRGLSSSVIFDANAGHLLYGKYWHGTDFAAALNLPDSHVRVVDKGTPADPLILQTARDLRAPIVTNDRYRDWLDQFPEARKRGHLIRGGYRKGPLWLDLPKPQA